MHWNTLPVGVRPADLNQLGTVICAYASGEISADITFIPIVVVDPTQNVATLIFNSSQGVFKYWDTGSGKYLAVTQFQPGDTKTTFITGDEIQQGWIVLDGRLISAIQGISQNQSSVLQQLFGLNGSLPTVTPIQTLANLPVATAYSGILPVGVQPPQNQFANLPFGSTYDPAQSQSLATNAETLRTTVNDVNTALTNINLVNVAMLASLRGASNTAALVCKVFAGLP